MAVEELKADELRACCDPSIFEFESTEELDVMDGVISQDRAVRSIEFALGIRSKGFNIYVAGPTGTGKATIVKRFVERFSESGEVPDDWLFVNNFKDPDKPLAVSLSAGQGCRFKRDMAELVEKLKRELPGQFESDRYRDRNRALVEKYVDRKKSLVARIEGEAKEKGFQIKSTPAGIVTIPVVDDEPVKGEDYLNLGEELREEIEARQKELNASIQDVMREISRLDRSAREEVEKLNREVALFAVGHHIDELKDRYRDHPKIVGYLDDVQEDILDNLGDFLGTSGEDTVQVTGLKIPEESSPLTRYQVNVLVDNRYTKGAPVIFETNPTHSNLVGQIERKARFGAYVTDFTMIKAGSILRANGGYLIVSAEDILRNSLSYEAIKRVLKNDEIKIEEVGDQVRLVSAGGPKPEPIPVKIKVVMIGSPYYFRALYAYDDEFRKIFKVRADFADLMERSEESVRDYARFIATLCHNEGLRHFSPDGVAAVVDYGTRLVEDQRKLSLRFGDIADIIREASYWTERNGDGLVGAESVRRAVEEKEYRSNLIEERIGQLIEEGTIMVDVDGEVVGQVNGLSVYDLGDFSFGKPSRITVQTYVGKEGVVNIERKAELSGRTHDKGVMILSGYLAGRYADTKPLSLSASVCFEQSYDMIDGDSASSTELFAILSALAEVPIRQGIAVTGSVNQRGAIQPIGGVNHKIEGFFDVCRVKGLTGRQGVIIPRRNVKNLQLRDAVVDAVREGRFHIWPIEHVDEGIEILTGLPAGERDREGFFPEDSINGRVMHRLDEMAEGYRAYSSGYEEGEGEGGEEA
jgi:lon-related putative ATP-dependent protease